MQSSHRAYDFIRYSASIWMVSSLPNRNTLSRMSSSMKKFSSSLQSQSTSTRNSRSWHVAMYLPISFHYLEVHFLRLMLFVCLSMPLNSLADREQLCLSKAGLGTVSSGSLGCIGSYNIGVIWQQRSGMFLKASLNEVFVDGLMCYYWFGIRERSVSSFAT